MDSIVRLRKDDLAPSERHAHRRRLVPAAPDEVSWRPNPPRVLTDPGLLRAVDLFETNMSQAIDVETMAARADLSLFHFIRKFHEEMGEPPAHYIRRQRLEFAATMICRCNLGLLEAALLAGYQSQAAFTRAFAKHFGCPPGQLRDHAIASMPPLRPIHRDYARITMPSFQPGTRLIAMRFHGPYSEVPQHWQRFAADLRDSGLNLDATKAIGVYADDPGFTNPAAIRYDCAILDEGASEHLIRAPLRRLELATGLYASAFVVDQYTMTSEAIYGICAYWLGQNRRHLRLSAAYELYETPPWDIAVPLRLRTLVPLQ